MIFNEDEIAELKMINPNLGTAQEGGNHFILISGLLLPSGCQPGIVDALLCTSMREGYNSRLYLSEQIAGCPARNWNGQLRLLDRNWFAISWQVPPGLRLAESLLVHLNAFRS
jgi:hypothetical protein